jgi:hypothetical protein
MDYLNGGRRRTQSLTTHANIHIEEYIDHQNKIRVSYVHYKKLI